MPLAALALAARQQAGARRALAQMNLIRQFRSGNGLAARPRHSARPVSSGRNGADAQGCIPNRSPFHGHGSQKMRACFPDTLLASQIRV